MVVLVPGLGLSAAALAPLCGQLADFPVRVGLLPAYGLPVERAEPPEELARRLLSDLRARSLDRVVLLGHSSSCQVVAEAAARDPQRVAGLVLVGPTTDPRSSTWPRLATRWLRTAVWERPWQVPLLVRDYLRAGIPALLRTMGRARRHDIGTPLRTLRCPVRVVRGRHDRIAPEEWIAAVADFAAGRAESFRVGAHMVPLTHPRLVAEQVRLLIADLDFDSGVAVP